MKKVIARWGLLLLTSFSASAYAQSGGQFRQWGEETLARIEADFRIAGSNLYYEDHTRTGVGFAWPIGVQLHALIAAGRVDQAQATADEFHRRYWCFHRNRWGYNAVADGCGDRYYDDNAWIAKALMELYKVTRNVNYLNRAREIVAFSMSGENIGTEPGGGIRFHENSPDGQCLCATAPTMVSSLMIYQATGIPHYLDDGLRLYHWVKANRFGIGPGYRGYENAVVAQAAILLYRITGQQVYLDDARSIGLSMESVYTDWNTRALKETGFWGGHDMTNAYVELYELDRDVNWLNIAAGYLSFLHEKLKDGNGHYPESWDKPGAPAMLSLLAQASAARAFAKMGTTPGGKRKAPDPVTAFKDCNNGGWNTAGLPIGRHTMSDLKFRGLHDKDISSLKVQPGYRIVLYEEDNFKGESITLAGDQNCLVDAGWNDRIRSVVVEAVAPTVIVYKNCNYSGYAVNLPVGDYTLADLEARGINNDDISSLFVSQGFTVHAYESDHFTGPVLDLSAEDSCLVSRNWNDVISSLKIR